MSSKYLSPNSNPADAKASDVSEAGDHYPLTRADVTPLIDGEETFQLMYEKISAAEKYIRITVWYPQMETILKWGKKKKSILSILAEKAADKKVQVQIIINFLERRPVKIMRIEAIPAIFPKATDPEIMKANFRAKKIEAVVATHPFRRMIQLPLASPTERVLGVYHDKLVIVDGKYAFCGGIEFEHANSHAEKSHRFSSQQELNGYRHDAHCMIEGPAVQHVETFFASRWNAVRGPKDSQIPKPGATYDASKTRHAVQFAVTKWKNPTPAKGILEAFAAAIAEAKRYIYIENQYFRSRDLDKLLADQLKKEANLQVILVMPVAPEEPPNKLTNHAVALQYESINALKQAGGSRVGVYSLRNPDKKPIYVHAKLMIIDDKWTTIGSANANNRSFYIDDEINLLIRDDKISQDIRIRLWKEHFLLDGASPPEWNIDKSTGFVGLWNKEAEKKLRIMLNDPPKGVRMKLEDLGPIEKSIFDQLSVDPDLLSGGYPQMWVG